MKWFVQILFAIVTVVILVVTEPGTPLMFLLGCLYWFIQECITEYFKEFSKK